MKKRIGEVLLWLLVINVGIALGAGLYESRIVVPQWISFAPDVGYRWNADAARQANTGVRFWVYVTTVPLTLITLANLIAAWRWPKGSLRAWWLGAAVAEVVNRVFTFSYFIPVMINLMNNESISQPEAVATALLWARVDWVRHAIDLAVWLAALRAFSLFYASRTAEVPQQEEQSSAERRVKRGMLSQEAPKEAQLS